MLYLKHWLVLCQVLLGRASTHVATLMMEWLVMSCGMRRPQLEWACHTELMLAMAVLLHIQLEFNASFQEAEMTHYIVQWLDFMQLA